MRGLPIGRISGRDARVIAPIGNPEGALSSRRSLVLVTSVTSITFSLRFTLHVVPHFHIGSSGGWGTPMSKRVGVGVGQTGGGGVGRDQWDPGAGTGGA